MTSSDRSGRDASTPRFAPEPDTPDPITPVLTRRWLSP